MCGMLAAIAPASGGQLSIEKWDTMGVDAAQSSCHGEAAEVMSYPIESGACMYNPDPGTVAGAPFMTALCNADGSTVTFQYFSEHTSTPGCEAPCDAPCAIDINPVLKQSIIHSSGPLEQLLRTAPHLLVVDAPAQYHNGRCETVATYNLPPDLGGFPLGDQSRRITITECLGNEKQRETDWMDHEITLFLTLMLCLCAAGCSMCLRLSKRRADYSEPIMATTVQMPDLSG